MPSEFELDALHGGGEAGVTLRDCPAHLDWLKVILKHDKHPVLMVQIIVLAVQSNGRWRPKARRRETLSRAQGSRMGPRSLAHSFRVLDQPEFWDTVCDTNCDTLSLGELEKVSNINLRESG